jgi:anaerobic ribonucleoside-triphosphate reductase activating protein
MHYAKINKHDIANGPGVRVSLFVSGCRNHCKGCFNPETWNFEYGKKFIFPGTVIELKKALEPDYIKGLTILGGDPFEPENLEHVTRICNWAKTIFPNKSIWVYTGYLYEDFKNYEIMNYIDVLVDGPFIEAEKDISLAFRGSRNQRIIDVQKSREKGEVVRYIC